MLHILLFILKIIGIVLLCIFGVLILGIACALFVPVRYRIETVRKEGEGAPPVIVTVKVTWLLHFVNVLMRFAGSLSVRARIMIFPVFRFPKRKKRDREKEQTERGKGRNARKREKPPEPEIQERAEVTLSTEQTETKNRGDGETEREELNTGETEPDKETTTAGAAEGDEKKFAQASDDRISEASDKKQTLWEKLCAIPEILRKIFVKIKSIFENIQYTIQNICDKIRAVSDTIEYYRGVIEGEAFQRSFALCKGELLSIAKRLKPDRFEAELIVGMDDPAATGEILAVCGILYPILGQQVNVAGDFEKKRLEGRIFIKGKMRLFTFVRVAVRIYFNKDIRKLYGLLKKEAV